METDEMEELSRIEASRTEHFRLLLEHIEAASEAKSRILKREERIDELERQIKNLGALLEKNIVGKVQVYAPGLDPADRSKLVALEEELDICLRKREGAKQQMFSLSDALQESNKNNTDLSQRVKDLECIVKDQFELLEKYRGIESLNSFDNDDLRRIIKNLDEALSKARGCAIYWEKETAHAIRNASFYFDRHQKKISELQLEVKYANAKIEKLKLERDGLQEDCLGMAKTMEELVASRASEANSKLSEEVAQEVALIRKESGLIFDATGRLLGRL